MSPGSHLIGGPERLDLAEIVGWIGSQFTGIADTNRLGITGISQGGIHSWAAAAWSGRTLPANNRGITTFPVFRAAYPIIFAADDPEASAPMDKAFSPEVVQIHTGLFPVALDPAYLNQVMPFLQAENFAGYASMQRNPANVLSVLHAMHMAWCGAKGETAEEIAQVLHLPTEEARDDYELALQAVKKNKQGGGGTTDELDFANALWLESTVAVETAFERRVQAGHVTEIRRANFLAAPDRARESINQWVAKMTRERITEIVPEIHSETLMMLVNALYFMARWMGPFEPTATRDRPFHTAAGNEVRCRMMRQGLSALYSQDQRAQILVLPYRSRMTMTVVLPRDGQTLPLAQRMPQRLVAHHPPIEQSGTSP